MTYLLLIFIAMLLQTFLIHRQYKKVQSQVAIIRKAYPVVSVGSSRGLLNRSAVLALDHDGVIRQAFMLAGFTIFARLREITFLNGKDYRQAKAFCLDKHKMRCIVNAVTFVEKHFQNSNSKEETHD